MLVRDLLWHVSGLADYTGDDWEGEDDEFRSLTCKAHVLWINRTRPHRAPGKRYEYNSGYALLARIVEEVSGQSYADFVAEHLFQPLGMRSTLAFDRLSLRVPDRALGYKEDEHVEEPSVIQGDGNIFSSAEDMARWDIALRNGSLIERSWLERAWTNGTLDSRKPISSEGMGYGFGWCIEHKNNAVSHSGSWSGTSTSFIRYLAADLSVIVLSNDEDTDADSICRAIATALGVEDVFAGEDEEDEEDDDEEDDEEDEDEDEDE